MESLPDRHQQRLFLGEVEAVLLGIAQDGGIPQAGCFCKYCREASTNPSACQFTVCLGLVDHQAKKYWMIDATPDFRAQHRFLASKNPNYEFAGVLLTHGHIGHYTGLIHLGPEAWNLKGFPIYASKSMTAFLQRNQPWARLAADHFDINLLSPGEPISLSDHLIVTPIRVPHRDEYTDTFAFQLSGPERKLLYCPDIDSWDNYPILSLLRSVDFALVDGTFYSYDEVPQRSPESIPHPTVSDSTAFLDSRLCEICFIHLNHTNPIQVDGPERAELEERGFSTGKQGMSWYL